MILIKSTNTLLMIDLLVMSYIDYKILKIPRCLINFIYIIRIVNPAPITIDNFISLISLGFPFHLLCHYRKSIGLGDVLLIQSLCFYFGLEKSLMGIYYTSVASIILLLILIRNPISHDTPYPFVPLISIGFMLAS